MATGTKPSMPGRAVSVLMVFLFISGQQAIASEQLKQLTQDQFNQELRKTYAQNDDQAGISLIRTNRFLVKPFVDVIIKESIGKELQGKFRESKKAQVIAEKTATNFEKLFGEKSLTIAVSYLNAWTREQKETKLLADSLFVIGVKFRSNDPKKSKEVFQQALNNYRKIGDERGEGEILGNLGLIFSVSDRQTSISYYLEALKIREKVDDKFLMGNSLNSIGAMYYNLDSFPPALVYFNSAIAVRKEIGDLSGLSRTLASKALACLALGQELKDAGKFPEALSNFEKALEINKSLNSGSKTGEVLSQIGFVYTKLGDYNTAVSKLTEATKIMNEQNDTLGLAGVYNNFGVTLQAVGRTEKAIEYYNNAIRIYEEHGKSAEILPILSNLGTVFNESKNYAKAEEYHKRCVQLSRELNQKSEEVNYLLNLANDQVYLGKHEEAMANYEASHKIARSLNNPELVWKAIAGMAEDYKRRGEIDKAVALNDTALKVLDELRNTLKTTEFKASFMAKERYAFEDIIHMLGILHEKDKTKDYDLLAFGYSERSKSRVLLDLLGESIAYIKKQANQSSDSGYTGLQQTKPVSLKEAQTLCPDKNTLILEYSVGDSSSCLWVITKSDHRMFRLPDSKKLQEQIETIRFGLLDPKQKTSEFFTQAGYSLYEELIKPAEPYLSKMSRLIIIPDGILNYLPFEVLLTDKKGNVKSASYSGLPFLIKKYPVSYGQSASVLKSLLSEKSVDGTEDTGNKRLIAFGDPVYENQNKTSVASGNRFNRLEYSGEEVKKIASFFNEGSSDIYLGNDANEENVKMENRLHNYNYVHFATHGFIDENKPDLSSLVLTRGETSKEDGFLQATEIFNLNLNADLVVLSACQTGLGKLIRGEGMVGLTRAFMYAGTPSVLVSLWSVSDISTATLMGEFYKNLIKNKLSKTDALRKAQRALMSDEKFAHPFYWAPFIIIGDWR